MAQQIKVLATKSELEFNLQQPYSGWTIANCPELLQCVMVCMHSHLCTSACKYTHAFLPHTQTITQRDTNSRVCVRVSVCMT